MRQSRDLAKYFQRFGRWRSHSAHPCVHDEANRQRPFLSQPIEILRLLQGGNRGNKFILRDGRAFFRQSGAQDHDRMRERPAQDGRFLHIGHTEQSRLIGQGLCDTDHAMAVSIRLNDREKLGRSDPFADHPRVVAQGASIDFRPATKSLRAHEGITDSGCIFFPGMVICGSRRYIG